MRAGRIIAAVAVGATTIVVGPLVRPAGASITTGSSGGNTVQVNAVGNEAITPSCSGGKVAVNGVVVTPQVNCSALIQLTIAGDGGNQSVYGTGLDGAAFSASPKIVASLGDGADLLFESAGADNVDMGPGDDQALLFFGGAANVGLALGAGTNDAVTYAGSPADDFIGVTSLSTNALINQSNPDGGSSTSWAGAERLTINGGDGDDNINTVGITAASSITFVSLVGQNGGDTLSDGPIAAALYGGPGTNTLTGGAGQDAFWSESSTDTLNGSSDAVPEFIYDTNSLRSGGRTLSGFTAIDTYTGQTHQGDVVMRVRPGSASSAVLTTSLTRPGQQVVPADLGRLSLGQAYVGALPHRGLADVVAAAKPVQITLATTGGGLVDVTVPTGTYEATLTGQNLVVLSSFGQINATSVPSPSSYRVHGPWTDRNQGFAHRVTRDLLFRFPTDAQRDQLRDQLAGGTKTRAQVAVELTSTDEYRGLDVDRVFVKYLRRTADPGGRTYWIGSLRSGKALWRFRAQLFGGSEYFAKAGGTNASYVAKAYSDVLGRQPDPSGQAFWTGKLNGGADRGQVALQFMNSPEARRRLVDDQFLRFLGRLPSTAEQSTWVAQIPTASGEVALIRFLAASSAYYDAS
jgi:hypothetical protein